MRPENYIRETHYQIISAWRDAIGEPLPPECLPPTGVVTLHDDGDPQAACFCYLMNAAIAHITFAIANPDLSPFARANATLMAVEGCKEIAIKELGERGFIWCNTHMPSFHRLVTVKAGFSDGGKADTCFIMLGSGMSPDTIS